MYRTLFSTHLMIKSVLEISTVEAIILGKFKVAKVTTTKKCKKIIKWFVENYSFTDSDGQLGSPDFLQVSFVTPLITLMFSIYFCRIIHPVTFPLKFLDASTNFDV